ncbi:MAG: ActS/PrrB/RegB family redox-sensitive histidine kinase [Henriciella sp.]|nr:ActS/PrrB/RegB family redox-sensitive histidine kinase [Henriciella sp.]
MEDVRDMRDGVDEALFSLLPEGLSTVGSARGRTRLGTLMTLRWMAVAGQSVAVLFVYFGLGFYLPLGLCLAVISASAWLNVFLSFAAAGPQLLKGWEAAWQSAFDVVQLALLIGLTGGLSNPFLLFIIAPVTVAASSLKARYTVAIAALAIVLAALMPSFAYDLPWREGDQLAIPELFESGHFAALCIGIVFFALSALRINEDEAKLVQALDAASVVMSREQRLSALGAMSAMTAHEMGTPLATIHLVSRELLNELPEGSPHLEDVTLIVEQSERCRQILRKLGEAREATDIVHAQMPVSALLEEAAAPHKGLGVALRVTYERGESGEEKVPIIRRSPEILHALGAFIENAVSFAETEVRVVASWTDNQIIVTIRDDGPGFAPEIMPKLGEPYVSQRGEAQLGAGDMGLGFFIAKTLIERTGGRIAKRTRAAPRRGAIVQAVWPRTVLQPLDKDQIKKHMGG